MLILHDLLGITMDFSPRFLRRYLNLAEEIDGAIKSAATCVRETTTTRNRTRRDQAIMLKWAATRLGRH